MLLDYNEIKTYRKTANDRTWGAVVHVDCYVTIATYLYKNPVYPGPWKIPGYVMITVDHDSPSMVNDSTWFFSLIVLQC